MRSPYYCNINGKFGLGAYEKPDFPALSDLLKHMDRLGVWQTVAYHSNARDLHPVFGNRFLLEDIAKTPGAKERVIPAFAACPAMLVGKGEMDHLISHLADGSVGVVVIFPITNRFRMVEYRRVFDKIKAYKPVIMMDVTELTSDDMEDLAAVANDYPELKFVLKQVMWWQYSRVFDLLHRAKNIYCDISWLHTRDAITFIAQDVGAERVIFGTGYKSHAAAAVAALSHAKMTQVQKDACAYDNFVSLLPEAVRETVIANRKSIDDQIHNRFWKKLMDEKPLDDVLVIDAHTHIGPFARSWYIPENEIEDQIATMKQEMEKFGIDKFVSQPETALFGQPIEGNRMVEACIDDKVRFRGNLVFNPIYSELYTEQLLDEFFKGGYYCGFKLCPEYLGVPIEDPRYQLVWDYANKHHMHILFHSWEGHCATAKQIAALSTKYPNATFIIGHTGGGTEGRRESEKIAQDPQYSNCVFEFCGTFTTDICWEDSFKHIDYRRVVYGTDTVVHEIAWELGRLLSLDIPEEWIEQILGNNMQKILDKTILPV